MLVLTLFWAVALVYNGLYLAHCARGRQSLAGMGACALLLCSAGALCWLLF